MANSVAEVREMILDAVQTAMGEQLVDKVLKQLYIVAKARVYDVYPTPKDYSRRGTFLKESGYTINSNGEMQLEIKAEADFNPKGNTEANSGNLAELITGGDGSGGVYGWIPPRDREPTYLNPRPWVEEAGDRIESSGILRDEVVKALKSYGFKVK